MKNDLTSEERRIALALLGCPESALYQGTEGLTLAEVGELMGVTRERVRQIELRALAKLKVRLAKDEQLFNLLLKIYKAN